MPGWQPASGDTEAWTDRCSDFTVNGWGFNKDPKNFVKLVNLFSDPAIYLEFAGRMQDPEAYARVAKLMLDPGTAQNYLEWGNPIVYGRWMQASGDPDKAIALLMPTVGTQQAAQPDQANGAAAQP